MRCSGFTRMMLGVLAVGLAAIPSLAASPAPAAPARSGGEGDLPTAAEVQRQVARCRDLLRRTVLEFYLPGSLDLAAGGYLEDWRDGKFVRRNEKFLTLQARQLWFFSVLAEANVDRSRCLEAANHGYLFLERAFRDPRFGGYVSKTDDGGAVVDARKHAYHNSFVIYGMVAYYRATRLGAALSRAQELFRVLDEKAHDARHGGYGEFFHPDWRPVTDPAESGYVGAIGTKTYNTHLHLLESFAALYRVWPDPVLRARLAELVRINTTTVRHAEVACNIDGWWPDWRMVEQPRNLRASYGHDVECLWLTLDAVRALREPEALYLGWAQSLAGYSLAYGYDADHGGFYYTGPLGGPADDTRKEWWVQAEAMVGMLELYRLTGDPKYYRAFSRTLEFVQRHQVAADGGWWATRTADGSAHANTSRSSMWQGAYHNGRALLLCAEMLSQIKTKAN